MSLPSSGAISIAMIEAEVDLPVGGAGRTVQDLYDNATGAINKTAPFIIPDDWYGYTQTRPVTLSDVGYVAPASACGHSGTFQSAYFVGSSGTYPQIGDTIYTDIGGDFPLNGGGNFYWISGEDYVIEIDINGVVQEKIDCNQSASFSMSPNPAEKSETSVIISITSNTSWNLSEIASWISLSQNSGTGNATVTATLTVNNTGSNRSANITLTYELGSQVSSLEQLGNDYVNVNFRYDELSESGACSAGAGFQRSDSTSLSTATILLDLFGDPAFEGYYSDGVIVRYWNGVNAFTSTNFCI